MLTTPYVSSDGFLIVNGTSGDDIITVSASTVPPGHSGPEATLVNVNGTSYSFAPIQQTRVFALGGDDTITVTNMNLSYLYGQNGADTITGSDTSADADGVDYILSLIHI